MVFNEADVAMNGAQYAEFVELKNIGNTSINLKDYQIVIYEYNPFGGGFIYYDNQTLVDFVVHPGEYYVVCVVPGQVPLCTQELKYLNDGTLLLLDWLPDTDGSLFLVDSDGNVVDILGYDQSVPDPSFYLGSGPSLGDPYNSQTGVSIARVPDGVDTRDNKQDYQNRCPSPGRPNSLIDDTGPTCAQGTQSDLMINEVDYTQPTGDDREFIEVHNRGNANYNPTLADPYTIQIISNSNQTVLSVAMSPIDFPFNLPQKGYWVLCSAGCTGSGLRPIGLTTSDLPRATNWLPNPSDAGGPAWTVRIFKSGCT